MAGNFALALSSTPVQIVVNTVCTRVVVKESEAVTGWPNAALIHAAPASNSPQDLFTAGKSIEFVAPNASAFIPGQSLGWVSIPSGTTTGLQTEK